LDTQTDIKHVNTPMVSEHQDYLKNQTTMNSQLERRIIIMGDWSIGQQMRNIISTPNVRLKRLLARHFILYTIDEFRTSCLHNKTEEKCDNLYLPDEKHKMRKMYSVLTYQMENHRLGCINRDRNACLNMRKLFQYYMENDGRPERYTRGVDI
jgi:hypothetical protein